MNVTLTFMVSPEYEGERLDKYLSLIYPEKSRSFFQNILKEKAVSINGETVTKAGLRIREEDCISVTLPEAKQTEIQPVDIPLEILYEDEDVILVNKPKHMVVHPAPGHFDDTLVNALLYHCKDSLSGIGGEIRPGIVHRIDRDTTGVLVVCKNDHSHQHIASQIKEHSVKREYFGIVCGNVKEDKGTIHTTIGRDEKDRKKMSVRAKNGRDAITHYEVLERFGEYTYAKFILETGRTHQIRVHMASIGHPLAGDPLYGPKKNPLHFDGQALHAATLGFIHPTTKVYMEFQAPIPKEMEDALQKLRRKSGQSTIDR